MMRLDVLHSGQRPVAKAFERVATLVLRQPMDDVSKTMLHRPEFFGAPFLALVAEVMRGPSFWTPAEREYMAACSSQLNECPFCARVHTETARSEDGGASLVDGTTAPRPELAATLELLEALNRDPSFGPSHVDQARAAGVPDAAIVDGLMVNFCFNVVNRLANAFECTWESDGHVKSGARAIHLFRYRFPNFVLR